MKTKNIFYAFVLIFLLHSDDSQAWDTTAAKFYPLSVGNVYIYDHIDLWFNCNPFQLLRRFKVVIDDYVLKPNGKKYFKFSGWWAIQFIPNWQYQRIDSTSMNVYSYDSLTNSEFLLDSLLINSGNIFQCSRFNRQSPYASCIATNTNVVFGTQRIVKGFAASYFGAITSYYSIIEGIGFVGFSSCEIGSGSSYSLKGCTIDGIVYGDTTLTSIRQIGNSIPEKFSLSQNYPNPFNPKTIINYSIPSNVKGQTSNVKLVVYNDLGKEIVTLVGEKQNPGSYAVDFNGEGLPSGVYFYKLEAGDFVDTKRMILIK